jgi:outer membrane protein OmpA-like peptidoglycan-associated protein
LCDVSKNTTIFSEKLNNLKVTQMKSKIFLFGLYFALVSIAQAEDLNDQSLTVEKIIEHFTAGQPANSEQTTNPDVNYRGLGIQPIEKKVAHVNKAKHNATLEDPALSLNIGFEYKSTELTEVAKDKIRPVGEALKSNALQNFKFKVEGHTDGVGSDAYNRELSQARAEAVKAFLVEEYNIDQSRIDAVGMGKRKLLDSSHPESDVNRRVRVVASK